MSGKVLFVSGFRLVVNIYWKLKAATFFKKCNWYTKIGEKKWNHIICSIKTREGRKRKSTKKNKEQGRQTENSDKYDS